ncbi:MAG: sigma-70 family RNA polymerase sigma factor [Gemmataceae bacterium]
MEAEAEFGEALGRLRQGDAQAAAWMVDRFGPELRRVIRMRLTDPFLRRLVDSSDIQQSVFANFFVRAALGQYELEEPKNLISLLVTMARNKVINLARDNKKEKSARNSPEAPAPLEEIGDRTIDSGIDAAEMVSKARRLLSTDEARLVEERLGGKSWQEIAASRNEQPDACRKQYRRALDRVAEQLGLTEE